MKETVGLRPFRETGPNLSVEKIGSKTIVHNYGHGGSGWSLSWGTALEAVDKALRAPSDRYAVVGCGAAGLTSAILLQRAGKSVTIYTKDRHPNITSSFATGVWSPDSRICFEEHATDRFGRWWDQTCRSSFRSYQNLLGLPGSPIEWVDTYAVSDRPWDVVREEHKAKEGPKFGHFDDYVEDLTPQSIDIERKENPFEEPYAKRGSRMIFNISTYMDFLLREFTSLGGRIVVKEFHQPTDFERLPEDTIINATGLGAKALFDDKKMHPVRGQLTFLIPQPELRYSFANNDAYAIPRRDGVVVGSNDNGIIDSTDLSVNPQQSFTAVAAIARSMKRLKRT